MWRSVFFILMKGCLPLCTLAAWSDVDLHRLTSECVRASNAYHPFQNDFAYKVLHTMHYTGWSGDVDHSDLRLSRRRKGGACV
ncbi:hypothetical protein DSCO28_39920 [Desulfosarcina ovata subsp. sediminis]|uniref:Secreted protein n=1 Tax=Desulfosarcina ovata subsp. sediminis TaxID=885957 RepID=A0A5K7ZT64_9BACT|nr:hypothetical protein [Desulfosarcina ovata]BBO83426.1 hypothetical protein DSCO28_39920 [Desulfosarcina ovata subsp. sediminis]